MGLNQRTPAPTLLRSPVSKYCSPTSQALPASKKTTPFTLASGISGRMYSRLNCTILSPPMVSSLSESVGPTLRVSYPRRLLMPPR